MRRICLSKIAIALILMSVFPALGNAQIALLDSSNTKDFFERHYPPCDPMNGSYYLGADEYQRYFRGWQWVLMQLMQNGLPSGISPWYEIINDGNIDAKDLANYKLLILSNTAMLSEGQVRAIQKWVIGGGNLLATFGSGYKSLVSDPREIDGLKQQKGGTFGLHQLWHDPIGKLFSSQWVVPGVDVTITRNEGPTQQLSTYQGKILRYGAQANLMVHRPLNYPDALGFLDINNPDWKSTTPAIISARQAKGLVVYFAFAPEYIVYKELEMPDSGLGNLPPGSPPPCYDGQPWGGRSAGLLELMVETVNYLFVN